MRFQNLKEHALSKPLLPLVLKPFTLTNELFNPHLEKQRVKDLQVDDESV